MIVISDTTPIITLLKINQLDLLKDLFGSVCIPDAVYNELVQDKSFDNEAKIIRSTEFISVEVIDDAEVQKQWMIQNLIRAKVQQFVFMKGKRKMRYY